MKNYYIALLLISPFAEASELPALAQEQATPIEVKTEIEKKSLPKQGDIPNSHSFGFFEDRAFRDFMEHRCYRKSPSRDGFREGGC